MPLVMLDPLGNIQAVGCRRDVEAWLEKETGRKIELNRAGRFFFICALRVPTGVRIWEGVSPVSLVNTDLL